MKIGDKIATILFTILTWFAGLTGIAIISFIAVELREPYAELAANLFGVSLLLLLCVFTWYQIKRIRSGKGSK